MVFHNVCQLFRSPAFWVGSSLLLAGIASNLTANENGQTDAIEEPKTDLDKVIREGTRIELRNSDCHAAGDRLAIQFEDDNRTVIALENLASQRILQALHEDATDKRWVINGAITEFQDRNFILLERVSRVSKQ